MKHYAYLFNYLIFEDDYTQYNTFCTREEAF